MKIIKPVFRRIRKPFKYIRVYLKQKAGWLGIPKIQPYRGFGNLKEVFVQGMVIEDKGLVKPEDRHKVWQNMLATIKRFSSDEIPGVKVEAVFYGIKKTAVTDEDGFFSFRFDVEELASGLVERSWHPVQFRLLDEIVDDQPQIFATGTVRIINPGEQRIIVSDIDDTVLISHSTQTFRKLKLMLTKNALTRLPFEGVSDFYQALRKGKSKAEDYTFFYVSSSEWNLYDLLDDFFEHHNITRGVFMLRKLNASILKFWKSGQGNHDHKYDKIKHLLEYFENQKFILIGDSGQKDPHIYKRLATEYPGRIESIYIRKVTSRISFKDTEQLYTQMKEVNTDYLEVENTEAAISHALKSGFINKETLRS